MLSTSERARRELDALVVNIELTLISIIQGIALYFLINTSYALIVGLDLRRWPLIASGLLVILLFWARAVIHTLTVICWPLKLGHNFLYIASTATESLMFTQISDTVWWHALGTLYAAQIWLLFAVDLRMMRQGAARFAGVAGRELFHILEHNQLRNVRVIMPLTTIGFGAATVAFALARAGGGTETWFLVSGLLQLLGALAYVLYVVRFLSRIAPLVAKAREAMLG